MRLKTLFYLGLLLLGTGHSACAQQLLCERELRTIASARVRPAALLRLQADSLRLLSDYNPAGPNQLQVRLTRVAAALCDTLPTRSATLAINAPSAPFSLAATNRRGQVLLAQYLVRPRAAGTFDSIRTVLQFLDRSGSLRWRRTVMPQATIEGISGIVEAPENGFFLVGTEYNPAPTGPLIQYDIILRIDSTGRQLWRRRYRRLINAPLANPTYTRTGTLVCTANYTRPGAGPELTLMEFNQRGDSLNTRHVIILPQQPTLLPFASTNAMIPLRDGGFALAGRVDSANTGYYRPFLARLSPQGTVVWSYVFRSRPTLYYRFDQPRELADGSLLVLVNNLPSGRGFPYWLMRFSATGQRTNTYPFVSQVLPANTAFGDGYFGRPAGLQPLSDSTLMLASGFTDQTTSRIYLAHLRVPGLPRVLDNHLVPAADPLAAHAPTATWPGPAAYPNPATTTLTLPYRLPPTTRTARLTCTDALGRQVYAQALDPRQPQATLPVAGWASGLYFVTLFADGQVLGRQRVAIVR